MAAAMSGNSFSAAAGDRAAIQRLCRQALARGDVTAAAAALKSAWPDLAALPFDRARALVVSSARPDLLADAMRIAFAAAGILVETATVAHFDMASARDVVASDIVVVCAHAEDLLRASSEAMSPEGGARLAREAGGFVAEVVRTAAGDGCALCCEITPFSVSPATSLAFDPVAIANAELARCLPAGTSLLTNADLATTAGPWIDPRLHALAGTPYAPRALGHIAYRAAGAAAALAGRTLKLVVTDLDGTLWPGVIAEDGIEAALRTDLEQAPHRRLRHALAELPGRGILLVAVSHNEYADATEALARLQDGTLSPASFAAIEAGWDSKPAMIGRLLQRLNLGAAAMMAIDDDPLRCAEIRAAFPDADVRHMDGDADAFAAELEHDPLLCAPPPGSTMDRTRLYEIRARAEATRPSNSTLEDFCRALDMRIAFARLDETLLSRAIELTRRTNQFNVTGWRPAVAELRRTIGDPGQIAFLINLRDRFGDHGLVGLVVAAIHGQDCLIAGFYLSCRALGRQIESAMLAELSRLAAAKGATQLTGEIATLPRNAPARDLYQRHGFEPTDDMGSRYRLSTGRLAMPAILKVET